MAVQPLYITSCILIRNGKVFKNGKELLNRTDADSAGFLKALYEKTGVSYPKFYKMDNLCKAAWAGAELLVQGTGFNEIYSSEKKGIFLQNAASSSDTDLKHAASIASAEQYFPSPAIFVYTLPNITIGEICIRHKMQGSSAFFIFEGFEPDFLLEQVQIHMDAGRTDACITGITEWFGNQYEICLFMVEKKAGGEFSLALTTENMKTIYNQS